MRRRWTFLFPALITLGAGLSSAAAQENGRPSEPPLITKPPTEREQARPWHVRALVSSRTREPDSVVASFEREHFSADYMKNTTHAERVELLGKIRLKSARQNGG